MRTSEDKELRDFEIRQWFYLLRSQYITEGMDQCTAEGKAYEDIGVRFNLCKSSARKARDKGSRPKSERSHLMIEVKDNLIRLKQAIQRIEKTLNEHV